MQTRRLVFLAIFLAVSIVLNLVERIALGGITGLPWVRLGLANIVVLITLYLYDTRDAFTVLLLRIVVVGFFTNVTAFLLSLSGGVLAFAMMLLFKRLRTFSIVSVSVGGAFGHAVGQVGMAIFLLGTQEIVFLLPLFMTLSVPTGIFTGLVARKLVHLMQDHLVPYKYE